LLPERRTVIDRGHEAGSFTKTACRFGGGQDFQTVQLRSPKPGVVVGESPGNNAGIPQTGRRPARKMAAAGEDNAIFRRSGAIKGCQGLRDRGVASFRQQFRQQFFQVHALHRSGGTA
jgi:hypothetical protein